MVVPKQSSAIGGLTGKTMRNDLVSAPHADNHTIFLSGPPGSGKTTLAAQRLRYLLEKGISFVERDVANDQSAQQRLQQLNPRGGIPTFEIDGQVLVGFSPAGLQSAIDRAARERAKRF